MSGKTAANVQTDEQGRVCCPACGRADDVALYSVIEGPGHAGPADFPFDSIDIGLGFHCGGCGHTWHLEFVPQTTEGGRRSTALTRPVEGGDAARRAKRGLRLV